ncbi:hypothetical protein O3M35_002877 [Rhynocoris fuscipes]|uniref:Reverse transcriptase zinc-binding domain-containing protein n=1 Tax=Rhynocoris fuscipes TaxID=488301 RepID=A0AAW1CQF4_9HEMI
MIVDLLTGHCRLNKHMRNLRIVEDDLCRYCLEEEESAVHILCHCEGLARLRFRIFGEAYPQPTSLTEGSLARLKGFICESCLVSVLVKGLKGSTIDPYGSQWNGRLKAPPPIESNLI